MVFVVDLLDILRVRNVLLLVFARHWGRWPVRELVQLRQEGLGLFCCERRTWLGQDGTRNLEGLSEDQLGTGCVQAGSEGVPHAKECPRERAHPPILVCHAHVNDASP